LTVRGCGSRWSHCQRINNDLIRKAAGQQSRSTRSHFNNTLRQQRPMASAVLDAPPHPVLLPVELAVAARSACSLSQPHSLANADTFESKLAKASLCGRGLG
jgi:hypothetical protein